MHDDFSPGKWTRNKVWTQESWLTLFALKLTDNVVSISGALRENHPYRMQRWVCKRLLSGFHSESYLSPLGGGGERGSTVALCDSRKFMWRIFAVCSETQRWVPPVHVVLRVHLGLRDSLVLCFGAASAVPITTACDCVDLP